MEGEGGEGDGGKEVMKGRVRRGGILQKLDRHRMQSLNLFGGKPHTAKQTSAYIASNIEYIN